MSLFIDLLGPLSVRDGAGKHQPRKPSRKARALLAYLAMQGGQDVRREYLAYLLWPDEDSAAARHNLRNVLLDLRKALGPAGASHLLADTSSVSLPGVIVDVNRVQELSRSADWL